MLHGKQTRLIYLNIILRHTRRLHEHPLFPLCINYPVSVLWNALLCFPTPPHLTSLLSPWIKADWWMGGALQMHPRGELALMLPQRHQVTPAGQEANWTEQIESQDWLWFYWNGQDILWRKTFIFIYFFIIFLKRSVFLEKQNVNYVTIYIVHQSFFYSTQQTQINFEASAFQRFNTYLLKYLLICFPLVRSLWAIMHEKQYFTVCLCMQQTNADLNYKNMENENQKTSK